MKIEISKIVPNPFRDFGLDPIDDVQVERLRASIHDLGFFTAIPARKRDGVYQQACNHHLLEAAKLEKREFIEVVVDDYTDDEMRRIMAIENLTQRGGATTATLDAVNAFAYQVAYETLSDRFAVANNFATTPQARHRVLNDGPGERVIYQVINGFRRDEAVDRKSEDERAELISVGSVRNALKQLKESGKMAETVAKAFAVVEAERTEDAAIAAEEQRVAEAKRQAEEERQRKAEQAAIEKADREAEAKRKAEEDAQKRQATAAEQERLRKQREAAEAEAKEKRRLEIEAEKKRRNEAAARQAKYVTDQRVKREKEAAERAKVEAQLAQERIYDSRCAQLFPDEDYAEAFRKQVTTPGAREFIAREDQYDVAKAIVAEAKDWKRFSNYKVGTEFISDFIDEVIGDGKAKREADKKARMAQLEKAQAILRVNKLWDEVKRGMFTIQRAMEKLVEEHGKWDTAADGPFPVNPDMTNTFSVMSKVQIMLQKMFGSPFGIPTAEAEEEEVNPHIKRIGNS